MHERKKRLLIIVTSNEIKIAFNSIGAGGCNKDNLHDDDNKE